MRLSELFDGSREDQAITMSTAVDIRGLSADSGQVGPGFLFAALPGARTDGRRFIDQAIAKGAVAILAEPHTPVPDGTLLVADANPRRRLALMAAKFYGRQPRQIAAVTRTRGQTSTAEVTRPNLAALRMPAARPGTLRLALPTTNAHPSLSTPDPLG